MPEARFLFFLKASKQGETHFETMFRPLGFINSLGYSLEVEVCRVRKQFLCHYFRSHVCINGIVPNSKTLIRCKRQNYANSSTYSPWYRLRLLSPSATATVHVFRGPRYNYNVAVTSQDGIQRPGPSQNNNSKDVTFDNSDCYLFYFIFYYCTWAGLA